MRSTVRSLNPEACDLFGARAATLVEDAEGGIRYWSDFAETAEADAWFGSLRDGADWQSVRRKMYDRVVDVPRLMAACRVDALPQSLPLADMLARVRSRIPAPFNAIGMNLYRDGRDSVAMHNDKLHSIAPGQPIALVSLGSARRMLIRRKEGSRESLGVELAAGSLLVMSHASQVTHEHGIPKTSRPVAERMSIVFRVRPPGWVSDY